MKFVNAILLLINFVGLLYLFLIPVSEKQTGFSFPLAILLFLIVANGLSLWIKKRKEEVLEKSDYWLSIVLIFALIEFIRRLFLMV